MSPANSPENDKFEEFNSNGSNPNTKESAANVYPEGTLFFPDSFADESIITPKSGPQIISDSFKAQIPAGDIIKTSWSELEGASEREKDHFGGVVYQCEELVGHFTGAMDVMNRNIFMKDRPEWDEGKFGDAQRVYVPRALEAITSKDQSQIAVLVEVRTPDSNHACLPPWQSIYPGPLSEFGDPRGGGKADPNKKRVKVATGVTLNISNEVSPESFSDGVGLILTPSASFDAEARFSPRRGDHEFEVEPIFSPQGWEQALNHLMDDVRLMSESLSRRIGQYGFGLSDIASTGTSFMLGYSMVTAREECHRRNFGESLILPIDESSYRMMGDVIQIKNAVATTSWGAENEVTIRISLDPVKRIPAVHVRKA